MTERPPPLSGQTRAAAPPDLPIEAVLPALCRTLDKVCAAVLTAPPGAGKTTRVPLALLGRPWAAGKRIVMLEPRRLAARAAARRMAESLGEAVGEQVGYRVRLDTKVGPRTRIEVMTEGIFLRQLQDDPSLPGIAAVIFDEFHERRLDADLALALCREAQEALCPALRLLVMSATLDAGPVARLLGDAPVIAAEGRSFPVTTRHIEPNPKRRFEDQVVRAINQAWHAEAGSLLVFLPGLAEIRRVEAALRDDPALDGALIAPLHGDLPLALQDQAIAPAPPGVRKIVLATAIAETSLTIEGIRVVIDGGLMRVPRFEPGSGMSRLMTVSVSQASAEQRRGRAGRLAPGVCYRLWGEARHLALSPFGRPEILEADLAPLALELANWGVAEAAVLAWLDPPPAAALAQARDLLRDLGAIAEDGRITAHGREMLALGAHPRLAHMMLRGRALGLGGTACDLAALLAERDILKPGLGPREADLRQRLELLRGTAAGGRDTMPPTLDRGACRQVRQVARQWRRQLRLPAAQLEPEGGAAAGLLVALAYPDRIARARAGRDGQYLLRQGRGAVLAPGDPLLVEGWLAVADLDGQRTEARIFRAAPLALEDIETHFAHQIESVASVAWQGREEAVQARRQRRLGALVLKEETYPDAPAALIAAAMMQGIRDMGLSALPWTPALANLRARLAFLRRQDGPEGDWPDLSDDALLASLEDWLAPFLGGASRRAHLARIDLAAALEARLTWAQRQALDDRAPTHLTVPTGSRIALDYAAGEIPVLAVRLQEMFGAATTPRIDHGRVPVLLHLLSPARRPVQVTRDLASFWAGAYGEVKRDLRGQYPKHSWPDDPLRAEPTRRTKTRR